MSNKVFLIVASGYASGPAQALVEFLRMSDLDIIEFLQHPLVAEGPGEHIQTVIVKNKIQKVKVRHRPNRPPITYIFDFLTPLYLRRSDVWVSFNALATFQGLILRKIRRTRFVVHWSVDFVPRRFSNAFINWFYETVDKKCCELADLRIELSNVALQNRNLHYSLSEKSFAQTLVVPMGFWNDKVAVCGEDAWVAKRIVFLGHLVDRMGLDVLLKACKVLRSRKVSFHLDIIGGGPLSTWLHGQIEIDSLEDCVSLMGFVADHATLASLLAGSSIGVAPYAPDLDSFTRFADPGKLKDYLGAGLPILLTDVPPNAADLAANGGAVIVQHDADAIADAIQFLFENEHEWKRRRSDALKYRENFDWKILLDDKLGFLIDNKS
jgi:glycosyltransferase involved in cell wall biosynthesis